jgi:hypothetical protein
VAGNPFDSSQGKAQGKAHAPPHFYVRMSFDGVHLLVTQEDIFSVEIAEDVQLFTAEEALEIAEIKEEGAGSIGWIVVGEYQFLVYALAGNMERMNFVPEGSRYCVVLQTAKTAYGLLCADMESLRQGYDLSIQRIPSCMQTPHTPFTYLAVWEGQLACVTSSTALFHYLTGGGEEQDAPVREVLAG